MTRDFNKPHRDERRPSSSPRHTPSPNQREEQPFKPARARLSRDTVDRAWENGANRQHADYRPRQNAPRPPFNAQGRPGPAAGRPQAPYSRPGYNARQENYRGSSSTPNTGYPRREQGSGYQGSAPRPNAGYQRWEQDSGSNTGYPRREQGSGYQGSAPRPNAGYQRREQQPEGNRRPFNSPGYRGPGYQRREQEPAGERHPFNEKEYRRFSDAPNPGYQRSQQPEGAEQRFNRPGNRAPGGQSGFQNERWTREQRGPAQPYREDEGRYQDARPPRFQQQGPARNNYRAESGPRSFERGERPDFARDNRPGYPQGQRDSHNPRWQSRPTAQRGYRSAQRDGSQRERPYGRPESEQFEGDYERFDTHQDAPREYEKHVTPMPDGRVLKGPRPAQRKQERFWSGVAEETSTLMSHTSTGPASPTPEYETKPAPTEEVPAAPLARTRKPATAKPKAVRTVKTTHDRGTGGMKSLHGSKARALKRKTSGPQSPPQGPVTRPSRRGYKWPTPGKSDE